MFYKNFEQCTYMLGNHHSIMTMMAHWQHLNSSFAVKMLFTEEPGKCVLGRFVSLLFMSSYCLRTAETPVNPFYAGYFGNQLWLVIVTVRLVTVQHVSTNMYDYKPELIIEIYTHCLGMQMTTTGYGDNVPASNLGRFVCVFVMLLGTILVSMMTAACTVFLESTPHQVLVTKYSLNSRRTKRIFLAMVPLLQFVFRVTAGGQSEFSW